MSNQLEKVKELIAMREEARLGGGEKAIQKQFTDERGTYVHVAKYHDLNFDFGSHERMIICIDGKTLVNYMIEYKLGVLVSDEGNIVGIDREYFDSLSEE